MSLPPCDCLNWCGDDPWLKDGRAEPCQERKDKERQERAQAAERQRLRALLDRLADSALQHGTVMVDGAVMDDLRSSLLPYIR